MNGNQDVHVADAPGSPESSGAEEDRVKGDIEKRHKTWTWAGRNPTKVTIPEPQKKSRKGQNTKVRKIREDEQRERCQNMAEELEKVQQHYHQELRDIATKYGRSFETIVNYVSYSSRYKTQRAPSLYLARVSAKAEEINKDKSVGEKVPLHEIRRMVKEEDDDSGYAGLTKEEEAALLERLQEKQQVKFQGARRSNKGTTTDFRQVVNRIYREIDGLAHRTSAHFVGFMSRSDIHDTFQPTIISDSTASMAIFKRVVSMGTEEILIKFEQSCCAQSLNMNSREQSKDVRAQCTEMIQKGLSTVPRESSIRMNYIHYDTDIIAQHHVRLDGWPMGIKFENLSNIKNLQDLRRLRDALRTTACKWIKMNKKQIKAHENDLIRWEASSEVIKRKWQERSDAHTTKPKGKGKNTSHRGNRDDGEDKENVDGDKESSDDEGDEEERSSDEELSARKRQRIMSQRDGIFRSCSIVDEADDA
ncbi:hypothetical protein IW262DRAFT_1281102 [Armillaria fumosa]|nr:hypothetical protein IW262DRAFT_1281102 [Armillaria fumosa]